MGGFGRFLIALVLGVVAAALPGFASSAAAEKRVALVIGNADYKIIGRLANPANDATAIAELLKRSGFAVETRTDLGIRDMRRAISNFSSAARDADYAVVYFAGHGIEMDGKNYLIATDAVLEQDIDIPYEALSLDLALGALEQVKRLRMVILDACRDNPFARDIKRTVRSSAIGRGLARIEGLPTDTLVAFAARAGSVAADGADGWNSPFASAVLKHLASPGLDVRLAFGRVRDEVMKSTGNRQEPFVYGSLGGANVALVNAPPAAAKGVPSTSTDAALAWTIARETEDVDALTAIIDRFPDTVFAELARLRLAVLREAAKKKDVIAPESIVEPDRRQQQVVVPRSQQKQQDGTPVEIPAARPKLFPRF